MRTDIRKCQAPIPSKNQRRARNFLVEALLLLAAFAMIAVPLVRTADAYIPAEFERAVGSDAEPEVVAKTWHSQVADATADGGSRNPRQGETFTYYGSWEISGIGESGTTYDYDLNFMASSQAPLTASPTQSDFTLPTGWSLTNFNATTTSVSFGLSVPAGTTSGKVQFQHQAMVSSTLGGGVQVAAGVDGTITAHPHVEIAPASQQYFTADPAGDGCSGTFTFQWTLPSSGGWLADIKFADVKGQNKLVVNTDPLSADNEKSYLNVVTATGQDITADVLAGMTYNASDSSQPFMANMITTQYPQARWLQSANWKIDTQTYTGDTWLASGTVVTVKKYGTHKLCTPGGFAFDWDTERPLGVALEAARPILTAQDSAQDMFSTPGLPNNPLACEDKLWTTRATASAKNARGLDIGYFEGYEADENSPVFEPSFIQKAQDGGTVDAASSSIALTEHFPNRVYYIAEAANVNYSSLMYYDLSDGTYHKVNLPSVAGGVKYQRGSLAMAFDRDGVLWGVSLSGNSLVGYPIFRAELFEADPSGQINPDTGKPVLVDKTSSLSWESYGTMTAFQAGESFKDIIFDWDNNMYALTGLKQGAVWTWTSTGFVSHKVPAGILVRFPGETLRDPAQKDSCRPFQSAWSADGTCFTGDTEYIAAVMPDTNINFNGLAWGNDGYLYALSLSKLYRIHPNMYGDPIAVGNPMTIDYDKTISPYVERYKNMKYAFADMGTCNYGPNFTLEKSVIDPVTAEIVEAGQAAQNPIVVDSTGKAEATYTVSVHNHASMNYAPREIVQIADYNPEWPNPPSEEAKEKELVWGVAAWIHDAVSAPSGFDISKVSIDGITVSWNAGDVRVTCPSGTRLESTTDYDGKEKYTCTAQSAEEEPAGIWVKPGDSSGEVAFTVVPTTRNGTVTEEITAYGSRSHTIKTQLQVRAGATVDWAQAGDCGTLSTTYSGGAYNLAQMTNDYDGLTNNYACVPITGEETKDAHLKLIKDINTLEGQTITSSSTGGTTTIWPEGDFAATHATDAKYFDLEARRTGSSSYVSGAAETSGGVAVDEELPAGSYLLREYVNDAGQALNEDEEPVIGPYLFGSNATLGTTSAPDQPAAWSCQVESTGESRALTQTALGPVVELGSGETVVCRVANQPQKVDTATASFAIKKMAGEPAGTLSDAIWAAESEDRAASGAAGNGSASAATGNGSGTSSTSSSGADSPRAAISRVVRSALDTLQGASYPHLGQGVQLDQQGRYTVKYRIEITNISEVDGMAGAVTDQFAVPAGLLWDSRGTATVSFSDPDKTGATAADLVSSSAITADSLAAGLQLVSGINNLPAGKSVFLDLSLPLVPDWSAGVGEAANSTVTKFHQNQDYLSKCLIDGDEAYITQGDNRYGVVNSVSLADESTDETLNAAATRDNAACVPLEPPAAISVPPLPLTGGTASTLFTLCGSASLLAAVACLEIRRRRRVATAKHL